MSNFTNSLSKFFGISSLLLFYISCAFADEKQFYTHRADIAGSYHAVILLAIKLKNSDCPAKLHNDWLNKELVQKQIISYFSSNYKKDMRIALIESEKIIDDSWVLINREIKKRRLEGVSCDAILDRIFWLQFDDAVKKWNAEIKVKY
jgi:hypothetical protein